MARDATRRTTPASGFTLIEIMAVVVIIGMLTGLVGYAVFQQVDKSRVTTAKVQISNLVGALELYRMDNGHFPSTEQGLDALVHQPTTEPVPKTYPPGGYLNGGRVPQDPWSEDFHYESPGQHNEHSFDLWSYGADGAPGGEGVSTDIGNWDDTQPTS